MSWPYDVFCCIFAFRNATDIHRCRRVNRWWSLVLGKDSIEDFLPKMSLEITRVKYNDTFDLFFDQKQFVRYYPSWDFDKRQEWCNVFLRETHPPSVNGAMMNTWSWNYDDVETHTLVPHPVDWAVGAENFDQPWESVQCGNELNLFVEKERDARTKLRVDKQINLMQIDFPPTVHSRSRYLHFEFGSIHMHPCRTMICAAVVDDIVYLYQEQGTEGKKGKESTERVLSLWRVEDDRLLKKDDNCHYVVQPYLERRKGSAQRSRLFNGASILYVAPTRVLVVEKYQEGPRNYLLRCLIFNTNSRQRETADSFVIRLPRSETFFLVASHNVIGVITSKKWQFYTYAGVCIYEGICRYEEEIRPVFKIIKDVTLRETRTGFYVILLKHQSIASYRIRIGTQKQSSNAVGKTRDDGRMQCFSSFL
jgi:hypothetical protein